MVELTGKNAYAGIPSPDIREIPINFTIPGLGWEINLSITFYALFIVAGIIAGFWATNRRWRKRGASGDAILDVAIWAVPCGLVGARLYHVFTSPDNYFGPRGSLSNIPKMWEGGGGIWGAIALGAVGAAVVCRLKGLKFWSLADAAVPGLLTAQGIGRWGNYFNQELYGQPTSLPWGLIIDHPASGFPLGTIFHPTFLYESLWCLTGALLLLLLDRRLQFTRGRLFWLYVMYYTAGRFWIENLRVDDAQHINLLGVEARLNAWVSLGCFCLSLIIFVILSIRARGEKVTATSALLNPPVPEAAGNEGFTEDEEVEGDDANGAADRLGKDEAEPYLRDDGYQPPDSSVHGNNSYIPYEAQEVPERYRPSQQNSGRASRRRHYRPAEEGTEDAGNRSNDINGITIGSEYGTRKSPRAISLEDHDNDNSLRSRAKGIVSHSATDVPLPVTTYPSAAENSLTSDELHGYPSANAGGRRNFTLGDVSQQEQTSDEKRPVRTRRERRKKG